MGVVTGGASHVSVRDDALSSAGAAHGTPSLTGSAVAPPTPMRTFVPSATTSENTAADDLLSGSELWDTLAAPGKREKLAEHLRRDYHRRKDEAWTQALKEGWQPQGETNGRPYELLAIKDGRLYVRTTFNRDAAISTATDAVREMPPYDLAGTGILVGLWDAGAVRASHQEFQNRVIVRDNAPLSSHATHVAGTLAAAGIMPNAKGMAPKAQIESYDWDFDTSELAMRAMASGSETNTIPISSHSYGYQCGWDGNTWYGTWGYQEAEGFGLYDETARTLDALCYAAPYLLLFKAAGNDRNDQPPLPGQQFSYYDSGWKTKTYNPATDPPADGWDNGGYDTIPFEGNAKNIMTVGAVNDAVANGRRSLENATMTAFSGWGPADDGRVKPDIVANGMNLYSTSSGSDQDYRTSSGTSMATPNAAGSAALLVEYYRRLFPGEAMRASTLKGLILHTADDLGNPGPDYQFGWGLMNTQAAAEHVRRHAMRTNALRMVEDRLTVTESARTYVFLWDNTSPIRATLCWTDPPGEAQDALDVRTPNLVHDLDLRILDPSGNIHWPYCLSVTNPSAPATCGDNCVDNVERVDIAVPTVRGRYTAVVTLKGVLTTPDQPFSLLISGVGVPPEINFTPHQNTTNTTGPYWLDVTVTCETALNSNRLSLIWNTTGNPRGFSESRLTSVGGDVYRGTIPGQPAGTRVYYFLRAEALNGLVTVVPTNAPESLLSFAVTPPVSLTVTGIPVQVAAVEPPYGTWLYASGLTITARAPLLTEENGGTRYACAGWYGTGSVPSSGESNSLTWTMQVPSTLTWRWLPAYLLAETSTLAGVVNTARWWRADTTAETVTAPAEVVASNGAVYRFCGWYVDGQRWPDDESEAANPATQITMSTQRLAVAHYLPANQDDNDNGVADWWERLYFGSADVALALDSDGDGYSNIKEYQDHTNPRNPDSLPQAPSIAHTPIPGPQRRPAPWTVTAVVTDNSAVAAVWLEWNLNSSGWRSVSMQPSGQPDEYTNMIPAPGVTGDNFQYRITALDAAGLRAINGPYFFAVRYPLVALMPASLPAFELPMDGWTRLSLMVSNAGHETLEWTLTSVGAGFADDVENGTNGWSHGGDNDDWHITNRRARSGQFAWFLGQESGAGYLDRTKAWLISPTIYLQSNATLSFWHWLQTEPLKDETHAWDGGIVELSTDEGSSFFQIEPVGGYPYVIYGHSASAFPDGTPCFSGSSDWTRVVFDLSPFAGKPVRLRFRFGADGYVVGEGWCIDDIVIEPYGGPTGWLTLATAAGTNSPQQVQIAGLTVRASGTAPSETRQGFLRFDSNDALTPLSLLPVSLHNLTRTIAVDWSGGGMVTPSGMVYVTRGSTTNFLVLAADYYHVEAILTNGVSVGGPLNVAFTNFVWPTILSNGNMHVLFAPDLTTNGVPIPWLVGHGLTSASFSAEALADQDGDGSATWQEYMAGTDPTNPASVFAFWTARTVGTNTVSCLVTDDESGELYTLTWTPAENIVLGWSSASNRVYDVVQLENNLAAGTALATGVMATPPVNYFTSPVGSAASGFFRVSVWKAAP